MHDCMLLQKYQKLFTIVKIIPSKKIGMYGFQILLLILSADLAVGLEIVAHPSSLLVPTNEIGVFMCKARCINTSFSGYWIINDLYTDPQTDFIKKGFIFPPIQQPESDELLMTLMVNASEVVNNSVISCEFDPSGAKGDRVISRSARLLVITHSPLSHNPVLVKNTTHVTVTWSPPFLWPGRAIEYYNVSFIDESDGSFPSQRVNSTFSDYVVSYTQQVSVGSLFCTSFIFCISAGEFSGSFQTINITSSSPRIEFPLAAINTSVVHTLDGIPALLEVNLQLPNSTCNLNYTLLVEDERGNVVKRFGPFPHIGSAIVKVEIVISDLKRNQVYSLKAQADLYSQVTLSNKHFFNTSLKNWDTNTHPEVKEIGGGDGNSGVYKATTGISLTLAIIMLLALVFVIIGVYMWHKHREIEQRCKESKQRVCQKMVPNPIYDGDGDGPMYDSVRPQYETLVDVAPARFTETHQASSVTKSSHNNDADLVRYVDQPVQLPQFKSQSFAPEISDTDEGSASRSFSVSLPTPRVMALKKNGQEHNRLQPTLNMGSKASHNAEPPPPPPVPTSSHRAAKPMVQAEPMEESYMVMNSASVLSNVRRTPFSDA